MTGDYFVNGDLLKIKKYSKHCLQRSACLLINLALLSGFVSLTGCAGIHLYNPDKDATASLVKKTSDEINFKAVIEEERKNQTKLLVHELEVVAQNSESLRNTKLLSLLGDGNKSLSNKLQESIDKQLIKLGIEKVNVEQKIKKAKENLKQQEDNATEAKKIYENALKEYKEALKQAETDTSEAAKKEITDQARKLQNALNTFEKSGILGKQSVAKSQIENIDLILDAFVTGEVADGKLNCSGIKDENIEEAVKVRTQEKCLDKQQALTFVAQLPRFRGRLSAIEALSKLPPVNSLLFEKERLMALKENADTQIERSSTRFKLLQQELEFVDNEFKGLNESQRYLNWAIAASSKREINTSDLYNKSKSINESARRHMVVALTTYLNIYTGPRRARNEIKYRLIDIDHVQALDISETALRLWEVAIKQPIIVLAAYHGSGMKREEIAKLIIEGLKAAGLFTIAGGVLN